MNEHFEVIAMTAAAVIQLLVYCFYELTNEHGMTRLKVK
jgi:hypothetical protein